MRSSDFFSDLFQQTPKLPFSEAEIAHYQTATAPVLFQGGDDLGLRVTVRGHGERLPTNTIRFAEEEYAPEVCKTVLLNTPESLRQETDPNEFFFRSTIGKLDFDEHTGKLSSVIPTARCDDGWIYCTSLAPKSREGMNDLCKTFPDRLAYRRINVVQFAAWLGMDLSRKLSGDSEDPVHVHVLVGTVRYLTDLDRRRYLEGLAKAERLQLREIIFTKTQEYESEQEVRFWLAPVGQPATLSVARQENVVVPLGPETLNCMHNDVDFMLELAWRRAEWEGEFAFRDRPPDLGTTPDSE